MSESESQLPPELVRAALSLSSHRVQQLIANTVSCRTLVDRLGIVNGRVRVLSFPRQEDRSERMPQLSVAELSHAREHSVVDESFLHDLDVLERYRRPADALRDMSMRSLIVRLRQRHPDFNMRALEREDLERICAIEGIDVIRCRKLPVLSALCVWEHKHDLKTFLLLREDIHPLLQRFLFGHELGHYFAHLEPLVAHRDAAPSTARDSVLAPVDGAYSSLPNEYGLAEAQADIVAQLALFPTAELMWLESNGILTADALVDSISRNGALPSPALESELRRHAVRRIKMYETFKYNHLRPRTFPLATVTFADLPFLKERLYADQAWGVLAADGRTIVEVNEKFSRRLGYEPSELVGASVVTIVDPRWHERLTHQLDAQRTSHRGVPNYILGYRPRAGDRLTARPTHGIVHTIPIVEGAGYSGSFGVVSWCDPVMELDERTLSEAAFEADRASAASAIPNTQSDRSDMAANALKAGVAEGIGATMKIEELGRWWEGLPAHPEVDIRAIPPPPLVRASHASDVRWIAVHIRELADSFPNSWIAVLDGVVIRANPTLESLRESIGKVPPEQTPVFWYVRGLQEWPLTASR